MVRINDMKDIGDKEMGLFMNFDIIDVESGNNII